MFGYGHYFGPNLILRAIAIIHFIRRRPDGFWLWIIIVGQGLGALVYIVVEVIPDLGLLRGQIQVFGRRKRIREMEGQVHNNPSAGNYEELGLLYLDNGDFAKAKACYDRALGTRNASVDASYRRAVCEVQLKDFPGALEDLKRVVAADPNYDFRRAQGLLAHAYAMTGNPAEAERIFAEVTKLSTLSETMYNYAQLLASQGRKEEARQWAQQILAKKPGMPSFQKRRERPWFRRASLLIATLR
jgi:hypothetical protein